MNKLGEIDETCRQLFRAICEKVEGEASRNAPMWDVGRALGLGRPETEDAAMNLVAEGLVEIRSLSGAIGLTEAGLALAGGQAGPAVAPGLDLTGLADRIEQGVAGFGLEATAEKDLQLDLRTIRLLAERSTPLAGAVKTVLGAIREALSKTSRAPADLLGELERVWGELSD